MSVKHVIIITCEIANRRCSGFACANAFYNREEVFASYGDDVRYISFTCGGCCGKGVASKLEHFSKKAQVKNGVGKDEVVVHLSSCMVTDNYHYDRCPHVDYIKSIVAKKGYTAVVEGTYISRTAVKKRAAGLYHEYD